MSPIYFSLGGTRLGNNVDFLFGILNGFFLKMLNDNNNIFHNYKNELDKNVLYLHDYVWYKDYVRLTTFESDMKKVTISSLDTYFNQFYNNIVLNK